MWCRPWRRTKTSFRRINDIEVLLEWLGSLQITNKTLDKTSEQTDIKMLGVPAINNNKQTVMLKSIVLDPKWFDKNRTKFEGGEFDFFSRATGS